MEFTSFEEPVGHYIGDPKITVDTIDLIYKTKELYPESDGQSNMGGWQKDLTNDPLFHPIMDVILDKFDEYLQHYELSDRLQYGFEKFFCNVNPPGAHNSMHNHRVGEFSGAFWLQAGHDCGPLFIMNPYPNQFINTISNGRKDYSKHVVVPEPNEGVFFNTNLVHYVDVNRSTTDRISIAYHIKLF